EGLWRRNPSPRFHSRRLSFSEQPAPHASPLPKALVSTRELASIVLCKCGQVVLQHGVEFVGSVASERAHRTLQHPQSSQQTAGCNLAIPFRLAAAQL